MAQAGARPGKGWRSRGGIRQEAASRDGAAEWDQAGVSVTDLCKLEDVLLSVYDFEAAPREPGAHVSSVQPALLVQHLITLFLVLVVPLEDSGAPHTDLPADTMLLTTALKGSVEDLCRS